MVDRIDESFNNSAVPNELPDCGPLLPLTPEQRAALYQKGVVIGTGLPYDPQIDDLDFDV